MTPPAKAVLTALFFGLTLGLIHPAQARTDVSVFFGGGYYDHGPGPYWGPRHRYAYPPYYPPPVIVAPAPPVVYAPPPAIVYTQPNVVYAAPAAETALPANQASPTFTDSQGRLCREYDTTGIVGGKTQSIHGTACLQPDGTWRVVQ